MSLSIPQQKIFDDEARFKCVSAGRRFGKTYLSMYEIARAARFPDQRIMYVAPTYRMGKQIIWKQLCDEMRDRRWVKKINESDIKNMIRVSSNNWTILNQQTQIRSRNLSVKKLVIYPYSLSNSLVKEAGCKLGLKLLLTKEVKQATIIIGLKRHLKHNFKLKKLAEKRNIRIFNLNQSSVYQLTKLFRSLIS